MSLQRRLALFLVGMVTLPLAAVGLFMRYTITDEAQRRLCRRSIVPDRQEAVALGSSGYVLVGARVVEW